MQVVKYKHTALVLNTDALLVQHAVSVTHTDTDSHATSHYTALLHTNTELDGCFRARPLDAA
jgi:hypothetical protein